MTSSSRQDTEASTSRSTGLHAHESRVLLHKVGRLLLVVGLVITSVNLVSHVGLRPGGVALVILGTALILLLRSGRYVWAAHAACWGLLFVGVLGAMTGRGIGNVSWVALPVAAIMAGWLLSKRAAYLFAASGIVCLLVVLVLQVAGYPFAVEVSPVIAAASLIAATLVSVLVGVATADSYRMQLQRVLRSESALAHAQSLAGIGSWTMDPSTRASEWSAQAHRIFAIDAGALVEYSVYLSRVHPDDLVLVDALWESVANHEATREITYRIVVGEQLKWIRTIAKFDYRANERLIAIHGTHQDITEQKDAQSKIEFLAYHDPLTSLPNRVLAHERLQQALAAAARHKHHAAILYLDLDDFKHVNDRYGHSTGDALLKSVSDRVRSCLRAEDSLYRLSGDEFMVILPRIESDHMISHACDRLVSELAAPFEIDRVQLFCTFSIGVAVYPQSGADSDTLMRNADTALYEAKKHKGCYRFFEQEMNTALIHYLDTRDRLRLGLERGEFTLYYQPQIDLRTGRVNGVEALLRWRCPEHGLLRPGQFIHVAETSGLIVPLGRWVLSEACRQAAAWHGQALAFQSVSVNLSSLQFSQGYAEQDVSQALTRSGLPPTMLELELTESTLLHDDQSVLDTVMRWKSRGINVAIDDFGTGYSNLAYIKSLSPSRLKIDKSFVVNLINSPQDRAIVQSIVQIGHGLDLQTTAEGVEHPAVAALLLSLGCDSAQGNYYGKPMPAAQFEQWLSARLELQSHGYFTPS